MTKYHISSNGGAAICKAEIKCRLGGTHYATAEEAEIASLRDQLDHLLGKQEATDASPDADEAPAPAPVRYEVYNVHTDKAYGRTYSDRTRADAVATDACAGSGGWNYKVREVSA